MRLLEDRLQVMGWRLLEGFPEVGTSAFSVCYAFRVSAVFLVGFIYLFFVFFVVVVVVAVALLAVTVYC